MPGQSVVIERSAGLPFTLFIEVGMGKTGQKTGHGPDPDGEEKALGVTEKMAESAERSTY